MKSMRQLIKQVTFLFLLSALLPISFAKENPRSIEVQANDTLVSITKEHIGDIHMIGLVMKLNGLKDPTAIKMGDILQLPNIAHMKQAEEALKVTYKELLAANHNGATTYAVKPYDQAFKLYIEATELRAAGRPGAAMIKADDATEKAQEAGKEARNAVAKLPKAPMFIPAPVR